MTDTNQTLRIVMVLPAYLPEVLGGAEQSSRRLSEALAWLGNDVTILAPRFQRNTPRKETKNAVRIERFRLRHAPNLGGRYFLSFLVWCVKIWWWLWRHQHACDVIYVVHARLHSLPAVLAGRALGKPVIIKLGRGGDQFDLTVVRQKFLYGPFFSKLIRTLTTAYVANSREIVADLKAAGIEADRVFRIPNGVDLPVVDAATLAARPGEIQFLYFGRFDPEKALDRMIEGFASIDRCKAARLTLVGCGACEIDLKALVSAQNLSARVAIKPPVSDVAPVLRGAHFFLSTSLSEGMSNAMLEAMAYGVVPIVSRVSGVDDAVEDGRTGFVFEIGDDEGFLSALKKALALSPDGYKAMAGRAANVARTQFGIDMIAEKYLAACQKLVRAKSVPGKKGW